MGTYLVSPQILKLVVPANAIAGAYTHDCDDCHRERARDCRLRSGKEVPVRARARAGTSAYRNGNTREASGCGGFDVRSSSRRPPSSRLRVQSRRPAPESSETWSPRPCRPVRRSPRAGNFYLLDASPGDTITQSVRVSNPNDHAGHGDRRGGRRVDRADDGRAARPAREREGADVALDRRVDPPDHAGAHRAARRPVHGARSRAGRSRVSTWPGSARRCRSRRTATRMPTPAAGPGRVRDGGAVPARYRGRGRRSRSAGADAHGDRRRPEGRRRVASTLGVHIANTGNAFAHGTGVIRVPDTNTDFSFKIDTFVPGTAIVYPMDVDEGGRARDASRRGRPQLRGRPPHELERHRGHRRRRPEPARGRATERDGRCARLRRVRRSSSWRSRSS